MSLQAGILSLSLYNAHQYSELLVAGNIFNIQEAHAS